MAEERDEGKEFAQLLLKSVQELTKRIEDMGQKIGGDNKQKEIQGEFQIGEGSGTSHHLTSPHTGQQVVPCTPPRSTITTFLASGEGGLQQPEVSHYGDYFAGYQSYGSEFRGALTFNEFC